eukprot:TRINITY_DN2719_c0_g1_i1.p1 TRINITY_DN2719_c0_g1~~TRINITY_DN2719_c0_g1_i1.p1  ORF type:complete len:294 (-),score=50.89 TRINITY_DN2719_c0_g1_i1:8-889(-)
MSAPIKTGWLSKEGGNIKSWTRRWFVLRNLELSYYTSEGGSESTKKGVINLAESQLCAMADAADHANGKRIAGKKNPFKIVTDSRVYFLDADTHDEAIAWCAAVNLQMTNAPGRPGASAVPVNADLALAATARTGQHRCPTCTMPCQLVPPADIREAWERFALSLPPHQYQTLLQWQRSLNPSAPDIAAAAAVSQMSMSDSDGGGSDRGSLQPGFVPVQYPALMPSGSSGTLRQPPPAPASASPYSSPPAPRVENHYAPTPTQYAGAPVVSVVTVTIAKVSRGLVTKMISYCQ